MFDEIPVFTPPIDEGKESIQPVSEVEEKAEVVSSTPIVDSADETKDEKPTQELEGKSSEGEEVSKQADEADEVSDEERQKFADDAEKRIADGTAPKWFKNYVENVYKPNLQKAKDEISVYEPLKDFGDVPQVLENLEILKGLESFETDPETNLPKQTVKPFVDKLVEKKGIETVLQVMKEFGELESPHNKGYNLFHEIIAGAGLDPTRLEDLKKFAQNGYRLADEGNPPPLAEELEMIPENLREAFISLSPEDRDEMMLLNDATRDRALAGIQTTLDAERKEKEKEQNAAQTKIQEEEKQKQQFFASVYEKESSYIDKSGTALFDSFAESLVNTGLDEIESLGIANLMSMTLNSQGVEARRNLAALEKIGVTLDESLIETFNDWMKAARNVATFEVQKNDKEFKLAKQQFDSLEEKLIRKSNPIVAKIAATRLNAQKSKSQSKSDLLAEVTKQKINGDGNPHKITGGNAISGNFEDIPVFAN
jgi:PAS domain-containing protein